MAFPVIGASLYLYPAVGVALVATTFLLIAAIVIGGVVRSYPHSRFGLCNAVTSIRAGMVCILAGALASPSTLSTHPTALIGISGIVLIMDGFDGWLARRSRLTSSFGARFDVETDALISAILAMLCFSTSAAGPAVLILGFTHYAFQAARCIWPKLNAPLPDSSYRKTICVVQVLVLIYALVPGAVGVNAVVTLAAVAVLGSFASDVRWLVRDR
ncbi:MAG: CDP-alcohol phosphatidyltransferase family protein [Pseudomonadota bacterium]